MLLLNLSPPKLCNGTQLKVVQLQRNLIEVQILTGCGAAEVVIIPRIPLILSNFPFHFKRLQFSVSVCFAMNINKSQRQTLRAASVDLCTGSSTWPQFHAVNSNIIWATPRILGLAPTGPPLTVTVKLKLL
ncbi:uncharacterized protein LOC133526616 [Cydia pomonella]|uniref:uncharacterized protein LOC133526616 n=1 Tax=Cydia pomonella TaxID=82600 RepID=UPI002ADE677B|nr:uncharacterized protein LOC133526616 [Cydia pomonella]